MRLTADPVTSGFVSMRLSTAAAAPLVTLKVLPSGARTVASVRCAPSKPARSVFSLRHAHPGCKAMTSPFT